MQRWLPGLSIAIAGCVQLPVSCGSTSTLNIDLSTAYAGVRDQDTVNAAECLIHQVTPTPGESDSIDPANAVPPFQFTAGSQNPATNAIGKDVMVSDSIVTIPVVDVYPGMPTPPTTGNPNVTVIGFLQVFLNSSASAALPSTVQRRKRDPRNHHQHGRMRNWRHRNPNPRQRLVSGSGEANLAAVIGNRIGYGNPDRRQKARWSAK